LKPAEGLIACNTHVDVMRWRPERGFLGESEALDLLTGHLQARRQSRADPDEPSGLLTHHLVMDEAAWGFVARLLERLAAQPAVRWISAEEAFRLTAPTQAEP